MTASAHVVWHDDECVGYDAAKRLRQELAR